MPAAHPRPSLLAACCSLLLLLSQSLLPASCYVPTAADVTLLPPNPGTNPVIGTIFGYDPESQCPTAPNTAECEQPMYTPWDQTQTRWWDDVLEELLYSRVNVVMAHGRGCFSLTDATNTQGNGEMCPRLLVNLVNAIDSAGAGDVVRIAMFDDTGAYQGAFQNAFPGLPLTAFDISNSTYWSLFWDHNAKIWHDTIPSRLWYLQNGRPLITYWGVEGWYNSAGNLSRMLTYIRQQFIARYGMNPVFNLDNTWFTDDPTLTSEIAQAKNSWFDPTKSVYTYDTFNGSEWGAVVPAYRDPSTVPGCGLSCREQTRNNGSTLSSALQLGVGLNASFTLLEGFCDILENAGSYRSLNAAWPTPNTFLSVIRQYSDPVTLTLRMQAEAPDRYYDSTPTNLGGTYRVDSLDVYQLPQHGWKVGNTTAGEWLEYDVLFSYGFFRFTANLAPLTSNTSVLLTIDGGSVASTVSSSVSLARVNTSFSLLWLGDVFVRGGQHQVRLTFVTGSVELDWLFLKKINSSLALTSADYQQVPGATYDGCYADSQSRAMTFLQYSTAGACMTAAEAQQALYFALQFGNQCYISSSAANYSRYGPSSACVSVCGDEPDHTCGGAYANAVYTINIGPAAIPNATFVGCYGDAAQRAMPNLTSLATSTSPTACLAAAKRAGVAYFAVQFGSQCFGSNSAAAYATYGASTGCSSSCPADVYHTCGGAYANAVYQVSSPPAPISGASYIGCFADVSASPALTALSPSASPAACLASAMAAGLSYIALQNGSLCFGGNATAAYSQYGPSLKCATICASDFYSTCGGPSANAVYSIDVLPLPIANTTYIGCYGDGSSRAMTSLTASTPSQCHAAAMAAGYKYMAIQFSNECYASNDLDRTEVYGPASCTSTCPGDMYHQCGGAYANSVYQLN